MENSPMLAAYHAQIKDQYDPDSAAAKYIENYEKEEQEAPEVVKQQAVESLMKEHGTIVASPERVTKDASTFAANVKEIPGQIIGGAMESVQELGNTAIDLAEFLETKLQVKDGFRIFSPTAEALIAAKNVYQKASGQEQMTFAEDLIPDGQTLTGNLTRNVTQFLVPYAGMSKVTSGIKTVGKLASLTKAAVTGAAVDFASFDPHEERFSNFLRDNDILRGPIVEYLAADKTDSGAEGRLKNALEGIGLGILTDGLVMTVKGIKAYRAARATKAGIIKETTEVATGEARTAASVEAKVEPGATTEAPKGAPVVEGLEPQKVDPEKEAALKKLRTRIDKVMENPNLTDDQLKKVGVLEQKYKELEKSYMAPKSESTATPPPFKPPVKQEALNFHSENPGEFSVDLTAIDENTDIDGLVNNLAKHFENDANFVKRGVQTDSARDFLAKQLGLTAEEFKKRPIGMAYNDFQTMGAGKLMEKSVDSFLDLAKAVSDGKATNADKAKFAEAFSTVKDVYAHFMGVRAEAGRALRSYNVLKKARSDAEKARMISEIINQSGGHEGIESLAKKITALEDRGQVIEVLKKSRYEKVRDVLLMVRINGILSGLTTTGVNVLTNTAALFSRVAERAVGRGFSVALNTPKGVAKGEVMASISGMLGGISDAWVIAAEALKKGRSSGFTKPGIRPQDFITASTFGKANNTPIGQTINTISSSISLPTRFMMAQDEFYKAINYRAELHALAARDCAKQGLSGDAYKKEFNRIINNPPDTLHMAAAEQSEVLTFTSDLSPRMKGIEETLHRTPELKFIVPFFRTPVNVFSYALERNPILAPWWTSSRLRQELAETGAVADIAKAKLALGSTAMGVTASLVAAGYITGGGPADPQARKQKEATGWKPYSIKIGDTYHNYKRLEPFGLMMGMAADVVELGLSAFDDREDDVLDMAMAAVSFVAENMLPETLTEGMGDMLKATSRGEKGLEQLFNETSTSLVPYSAFLRSIRKEVDPLKRDTKPDETGAVFEQIWNNIRNLLPWKSKDLPPMLDIFGDEISYDPALGPDMASPITTSKLKSDPVAKELGRLQIAPEYTGQPLRPAESELRLRTPARIIFPAGGPRVPVALEPKEYHTLCKLSAGIGLSDNHPPLKQKLAEVIKSDSYKNKSDQVKRATISHVVQSYQSAAEHKILLTEPRLLTLLRKQKLEGKQVLIEAPRGETQ